MRKKMYWGIASLILIIGVMGVYFMLQPDPGPEPEKRFIVPTEAENRQDREKKQPQQPVSEVVKPPPPGASPNGRWHNGEGHDESHRVVEVSDAKVSTDEQATPVVGQQANTQIDAAILESTENKLKDPEVYKAWVEWSKKHNELAEKFSQVSHDFINSSPSTKEEQKQYDNDPAWKRRLNETLQKSGKIYTMMREHEKKNPLLQ